MSERERKREIINIAAKVGFGSLWREIGQERSATVYEVGPPLAVGSQTQCL